MRVELGRSPTADTVVEHGTIAHPMLGCAAATGSPAALELGLESQRPVLVVGRHRIALPPWLTSAAIPLPADTARAVGATLRHQASGMAPLLAAGAASSAAGLATASTGFVGIGGFALLVLASVLVHELGHVVAYRVLFGAEAPAVVVVRGAACHVVRRADGSRADAAVVVAGGAAPVVTVLAALPLAAIAPGVVLLGALVALGHLAALALPVGDGASLRELVGRRRRARLSAAAASTTRRTRPRAG